MASMKLHRRCGLCGSGSAQLSWALPRPVAVRRPVPEQCATSSSVIQSVVGPVQSAQCKPAVQTRRSRCRLVCHASFTAPTIDAAAYSQPGPLSVTELDTITVTVGGDAELPITAQIRVSVPRGASRGPKPLVLLSAGFLLNASLYNSYATHLASWGYPTVLYDVSEVMDDTDTVKAMKKILDTCLNWSKVKQYLSSDGAVVLVGHSRGGKLSCLTAAQDSNVKGLVLLDPVDNTPMTPSGDGYPSALGGLVRSTAPPRSLPVLVIGAGSGGDVVPENANYKRFALASRGPMWNCELVGAGHLAFLDKQVGLFSLFSAPGATPDDQVRSVTKVALMTWLEHAIAPHNVPPIPCAAALQTAERAMQNIVRNAIRTDNANLGLLPHASRASSFQSHSHSSGAGSNASSHTSHPPLTETYEMLIGRRAKELKAMLVERGIPCADCFEKEMLAKRLVETCGSKR